MPPKGETTHLSGAMALADPRILLPFPLHWCPVEIPTPWERPQTDYIMRSSRISRTSCVCIVCFQCLSHVWLFATPWTVAWQAPLSMGFSQARIPERVAISSSRGSSQLRDQTCISSISLQTLKSSVWFPLMKIHSQQPEECKMLQCKLPLQGNQKDW